jgi:hypothetical protein
LSDPAGHRLNLSSVFLTQDTSQPGEIRVATDDAMKAATKKTVSDYPPIAMQLKIAGKVQTRHRAQSRDR